MAMTYEHKDERYFPYGDQHIFKVCKGHNITLRLVFLSGNSPMNDRLKGVTVNMCAQAALALSNALYREKMDEDVEELNKIVDMRTIVPTPIPVPTIDKETIISSTVTRADLLTKINQIEVNGYKGITVQEMYNTDEAAVIDALFGYGEYVLGISESFSKMTYVQSQGKLDKDYLDILTAVDMLTKAKGYKGFAETDYYTTMAEQNVINMLLHGYSSRFKHIMTKPFSYYVDLYNQDKFDYTYFEYANKMIRLQQCGYRDIAYPDYYSPSNKAVIDKLYNIQNQVRNIYLAFFQLEKMEKSGCLTDEVLAILTQKHYEDMSHLYKDTMVSRGLISDSFSVDSDLFNGDESFFYAVMKIPAGDSIWNVKAGIGIVNVPLYELYQIYKLSKLSAPDFFTAEKNIFSKADVLIRSGYKDVTISWSKLIFPDNVAVIDKLSCNLDKLPGINMSYADLCRLQKQGYLTDGVMRKYVTAGKAIGDVYKFTDCKASSLVTKTEGSIANITCKSNSPFTCKVLLVCNGVTEIVDNIDIDLGENNVYIDAKKYYNNLKDGDKVTISIVVGTDTLAVSSVQPRQGNLISTEIVFNNTKFGFGDFLTDINKKGYQTGDLLKDYSVNSSSVTTKSTNYVDPVTIYQSYMGTIKITDIVNKSMFKTGAGTNTLSLSGSPMLDGSDTLNAIFDWDVMEKNGQGLLERTGTVLDHCGNFYAFEDFSQSSGFEPELWGIMAQAVLKKYYENDYEYKYAPEIYSRNMEKLRSLIVEMCKSDFNFKYEIDRYIGYIFDAAKYGPDDSGQSLIRDFVGLLGNQDLYSTLKDIDESDFRTAMFYLNTVNPNAVEATSYSDNKAARLINIIKPAIELRTEAANQGIDILKGDSLAAGVLRTSDSLVPNYNIFTASYNDEINSLKYYGESNVTLIVHGIGARDTSANGDYNEKFYDMIFPNNNETLVPIVWNYKNSIVNDGIDDTEYGSLLDYYNIWNRSTGSQYIKIKYLVKNQIIDAYDHYIKDPDKKLNIIAHSLGSQIIFEVLHELSMEHHEINIYNFVTLGSPISGFKKFTDLDKYKDFYPSNVTKWNNIYSTIDPYVGPYFIGGSIDEAMNSQINVYHSGMLYNPDILKKIKEIYVNGQ